MKKKTKFFKWPTTSFKKQIAKQQQKTLESTSAFYDDWFFFGKDMFFFEFDGRKMSVKDLEYCSLKLYRFFFFSIMYYEIHFSTYIPDGYPRWLLSVIISPFFKKIKVNTTLTTTY